MSIDLPVKTIRSSVGAQCTWRRSHEKMKKRKGLPSYKHFVPTARKNTFVLNFQQARETNSIN
jgi:hypothetical protein